MEQILCVFVGAMLGFTIGFGLGEHLGWWECFEAFKGNNK